MSAAGPGTQIEDYVIRRTNRSQPLGVRLPQRPFIYEINTWPWLTRLAAREGSPVDLASVPDEEWDGLADAGYDAVWLMGVWQRSPAGRDVALRDAALRQSFADALPGYGDDDVVGSPYCIRDYAVDPHLGGREALAAARGALAERGLGLLLDYVPNHVAPDHRWVAEHPDRFLRGTTDDLQAQPDAFVQVGGQILANGRDPYFAAWPDVVQLDAFSPDLRAAAATTLNDIADQCDGVRCDMAMLVMNDIFTKTWGDRAGGAPADDYWATLIPAVRQAHPGFLFVAEAYWDLEWALQQQGFDFCYDKRLYDRLVAGDGEQTRLHLLADLDYQQGLLRFVENHDEPRVAAILDRPRHHAVAVATLTQTGARLVHFGQDQGWRTRLPVFLGRFPDEPTDDETTAFYRSLLAALTDDTFRNGSWQLCERSGWPGNDGYTAVVAWSWSGKSRWLVAVNLADATSAAHVRAPWPDLHGHDVLLTDPTQDKAFRRAGDDLADGLYVELPAWGWHLLHVLPASDGDSEPDNPVHKPEGGPA